MTTKRTRRPKIFGIYIIENSKRGRVYVGSSVDAAMRWNSHLVGLLTKTHPNKGLQDDWLADGSKYFAFRIVKTFILKPSSAQIRQEEQKIIDKFDPAKIYNLVRAVKKEKIKVTVKKRV